MINTTHAYIMGGSRPDIRSGNKRPMSRGMIMVELALKRARAAGERGIATASASCPVTAVDPVAATASASCPVTAVDPVAVTASASCPVTVGDYGRPTTTLKAGTFIKDLATAIPQTFLKTARTSDQPVITEMLCCEELVTFTSIAESDFETSVVSDSESPLDDSDLDETYKPTKNKQEDTESSSNSGESGQEEELAEDQVPEDNLEEEAHKRPKKKKGVNYRKQNVENRRLGKEYKGKKKVERKTIEVTRSPRSIGDRCHHGCNEGQIRNKGGQQCENVSEEQRQQIFADFWKMTWDQRRVYVSSQVEACPIKRQTTGGQSRKSQTYKYRLQVNNKQVPVCQTMFLSTLNIGAWSVHEWANL